MSLYRLVGGFVLRHWRAYLLAAFMLIGVAVLTVWIPRQVGQLIDRFVDPTAPALSSAALTAQLLLLLVMGAAIYLLRVGWRLQLFTAAYRLGLELRERLYQRLASQGPSFFNQQKTGDLMARATNDVDAIEMAAGEAFLAAFDGTLTLVLVVGMMTLGIDWRLGLVALLPFPFMAWAFWFISRRVHDAWRESLDCFSRLNEQVQETMAGVRTVHALGLEQRTAADFATRAKAAADASYRAQTWESAYEPAVGVTLTAATVISLGMGGWLVWQAQITVGQLTAFTMYLGQLIWPMFAAGWVLSLMERGKAGWQRLQPILDAPLTMDDHGQLQHQPAGLLQLNDLSFYYPAQPADKPQAALQDIDITLATGQTLGVVGPAGAGKSTLLRLLLKHYLPSSGEIRWGGHALDDYPLTSLYNSIAWVPQEAFLFSATLAENIALAAPDASAVQIEHAAHLAALHDDVVRLPAGYQTAVGERGVTLSGGQRQRVAIARALLVERPLLLLDDALSAVDTGTETRILSHLRAERRGRSAVIVSHRLSAVMDADEIIVLKAGRIVERGTHQQLLQFDGWYAAQWRYQQLEASLEQA